MITCPVLVCQAGGDDISTSAPRLFQALPGKKEYVLFTAAEGAGDHCEAGARPSTTRCPSAGWTVSSGPIRDCTVPLRP